MTSDGVLASAEPPQRHLGRTPIDRERAAELDKIASSRQWHDPDANRACPIARG